MPKVLCVRCGLSGECSEEADYAGLCCICVRKQKNGPRPPKGSLRLSEWLKERHRIDTSYYEARHPGCHVEAKKRFMQSDARKAYKKGYVAVHSEYEPDKMRRQRSARNAKMGLPPIKPLNTAENKATFLAYYRNSGVIRSACDHTGISRDAFEQWRKHDPAFQAKFLEYQQDYADVLEMAARQRALSKSDNMLMFLLRHNRPEIYGDKVSVHVFLRDQAQKLAEEFGLPVEDVLNQVEEILKDARQTA